MHALLKWLLDFSTPGGSNKGPKIKVKGGQKQKIGNIEENNAVGMLKLF